MYQLTVKLYRRWYEKDPVYTIETVLIRDDQLGKWLAEPKNWNREVLSYHHC